MLSTSVYLMQYHILLFLYSYSKNKQFYLYLYKPADQKRKQILKQQQQHKPTKIASCKLDYIDIIERPRSK